MTYKWLTSRFTKRSQDNEDTTDSGKREPLDHPALARMTQAQLADLPIPSYIQENCTGNIRVN